MQMAFVPSYIALFNSGELERRADTLDAMLAPCTICPHECGNDRFRGGIARCHTAYLPVVSSYVAHFGEEPLLVGTRGVGNIFFGNCNLRCVYCQNSQISQNHRIEARNTVSLRRLADMMLELQEQGCHEIGLVSPTHVVPQIVRALLHAVREGLRLPLVYNTNAYDSLDVLRLLDGIIDIYLPDLKYSDEEMGHRFSGIHNYPAVAREAIGEMHRQVGTELTIGDDGLVKRGLILRHLVLPNDIAGSRESLGWVASELGQHTTLSVMSQYYPAHKAAVTPLLDRVLRQSEYERVCTLLEQLGCDQGWVQEFDSPEYYRPDFDNRLAPFKGVAENGI